LSRRVCRCASKQKIKIELLEAHWERERERETNLQLWHLQGAFPSSSFLIIADYLSLHHPTQVCFFFSAAVAVVLSSVSSHVWRLLSHLLLKFWDWSSVSWDWNRLGVQPSYYGLTIGYGFSKDAIIKMPLGALNEAVGGFIFHVSLHSIYKWIRDQAFCHLQNSFSHDGMWHLKDQNSFWSRAQGV
jgi:hypothetical protein